MTEDVIHPFDAMLFGPGVYDIVLAISPIV